MSDKWVPVKTVSAVKFDDLEAIRVWLDRTHSGLQGGIGRKTWNAEQKSRFDGKNKNRAAQALLDYAEKEGMITAEDRKGKITTVQRFLGNDVFREAMGFDQSNPDQIARTRPKSEFDIIARRFMRDLVGQRDVTSRMNKDDIIKYARPLAAMQGVTTARLDAEALSTNTVTGKPKTTRKKKPKRPEIAKHVQYEEDIFQALKAYGNGKLESLYHSICSVELDRHTPLVAIGAWAFFETLTSCGGRKDSNSFPDYLQKSKLTAMGIAGSTVAIKDALKRMSDYGNTNKHHPVAATFNGEQLNNDMIALKEVVLKCVAEAVQRTT